MIKLYIGSEDVSRRIKSVRWSGSVESAARLLRAEMLGSRASAGDSVRLAEDGKELFRGVVLYADATEDGASIEAADMGIYLMRNRTFREYTGTADKIAARVLAEFGVSAGRLPARSRSVKVTSSGNKTAYEVIMKAYMEGGVRQEYFTRMSGRAFNVIKRGSEYAGSIGKEIESASTCEDVRRMVNRVVIVTRKGRLAGSVENAAERKKYGTFQDTRTVVRKADNDYEARLMLSGTQKTAKVRLMGKSAFIAGKSADVREAKTGLSGRYLITADTHYFDANGHMAELELARQ